MTGAEVDPLSAALGDGDRVWTVLAELRAAGATPTVDARLRVFEQRRTNLPPGAWPEAAALLAEVRDLSDGDRFAGAVYTIVLRWVSLDAAQRVAWYREALKRVADPSLRDELRLAAADVHSLGGDQAEAARLLALVSPDGLSDRATNAYALQVERLGRHEEAEAAWLGLLDRPALSPRLRGLAWSYVASVRATVGRMDEVEAALAAADAVVGVDDDVRMHVATTRFDFAIRRRDLRAARAALDGAPVSDEAHHRQLFDANRACLAALGGDWQLGAFELLTNDVRADLRLLGATGRMGAAAAQGDAATALEALLTAERARVASPVVLPELAWMAEIAAKAFDEGGLPRREVARARRLAAQAYLRVDVARARQQRTALALVGVPLLGPFELGAVLGRGGGGTVFRATHTSGVPAAVKVLHEATGRSRDLLENELRSVAGLDHPCIARLFDIGIVDEAEAATHGDLMAGTRWVASELVEGGELSRLCGVLPWERILVLMLGILDALAHAHARDLLHLDIKPANLLLHPSGAPVLVDFGLARGIGSGRPQQLAGTPEYMGPELFESGWTNVGPATDLFAAGCVLSQLVSGAPPFVGSPNEVRQQQSGRGRLPLKPRVPVPNALTDWLRIALAPTPGDRFPTAASAAQALVQLGSAVGVSVLVTPLPEVVASETPTVVLGSLLAPLDASEGVARTLAPPEPPLPQAWERFERRVRPEIATASLGLFRFCRLPLVGRRTERSVLWSSLVQADRGERVVVVVTGAAGSGRRALVRWLVERAREVGVGRRAGVGSGRVEVAHLHEPDLATVVAQTAPLVIVTASGWPDAWPDAVEVALGPLDGASMREVLDRSLRLTDELASALVSDANGLPGRLLDHLSELVDLDRIVEGTGGYRLRPGALLRESAPPR